MKRAAPKRARKTAKPSSEAPEKSRVPRVIEKSSPRPVGRPPLPPEVRAARASARQSKAVEKRRVSDAINTARIRYIQGFTPPDALEGSLPRFEPLREVAEALGVSARALEERSRLEGWGDQRLEFQAGVIERSKLLATRKLGLQQAAVREEIHAGARLGVRKVIDKLREEHIDMLDLHRALATFDRGLRVTERAVNPDLDKEVAAAAGSTRWVLLREGLPPDSDSGVIDVIPEEDIDG